MEKEIVFLIAKFVKAMKYCNFSGMFRGLTIALY